MVGCLGMAGAPEWAAADPPPDSVRGYPHLASLGQEPEPDTGPEVMGSGSLTAYVPRYYSAFDHPPLSIGVEQAQGIVHGAVAYARSLGFEPAPGFADATVHLGTPPGDLPAIGFGRDGKPFYFGGPYDDPRMVVRTLERTCGPGNYYYVAQL